MEYLLIILFFFVAFIYSSVGMGGGSSYTALMAIFGINYIVIPTASLSLNLIVTSIGMVNFWRNGHGRFGLIFPFLVTSIPMAYFAGLLNIPKEIFQLILGYSPRKKSWLKIFLYSQPILLAIHGINILIGGDANYFYTLRPPIA